jgi:hypothetical protein
MSLVARYYGLTHRINPSDPTQLLWCSEGSEHNNNWSVKYLPGQPEIYDLSVRRGYLIAETSNGLFYCDNSGISFFQITAQSLEMKLRDYPKD